MLIHFAPTPGLRKPSPPLVRNDTEPETNPAAAPRRRTLQIAPKTAQNPKSASAANEQHLNLLSAHNATRPEISESLSEQHAPSYIAVKRTFGDTNLVSSFSQRFVHFGPGHRASPLRKNSARRPAQCTSNSTEVDVRTTRTYTNFKPVSHLKHAPLSTCHCTEHKKAFVLPADADWRER